MADDVLFEFLLIEMVEQMTQSTNDKEKSLSKLELLGYRVGQSMVERLTKDTQRFRGDLDAMKFICKEFWSSIFKKQIDNLRTNHHGIYVLQENRLKLLSNISNNKQFIEHAPKYLAFPCGLLRGALANLGFISIVTADVTVMPTCKFQIQIQRM